MSEDKPLIRGLDKFPSTTRIRGLEKFGPKGAPEGVGDAALSETVEIRGLDKFSGASEAERHRLIPEGYDMSQEVAERVQSRAVNPDLKPFEDPEGVIIPGLLLTSGHDPDHRRLVTNVYTTPRGVRMVAVHIEGEPGLRNVTIEDLRRRIAEGQLKLD